VEGRVDDASQYFCTMDDLRPLAPEAFNPFLEVWRRAARVPPEARARVLRDLEPGALRALWKASMGRYVLGEELQAQLFAGHNVTCDFPTEPGEVRRRGGRGAWGVGGRDACLARAAGAAQCCLL
jgi:hypothetical protein